VTPAARLCTSCGACCDGTLFDEVPLERDEVALGKRLSLPIVPSGDDAAMNLPCPALVDATCSVYDQRPSTCRTFRCELLLDVEAARVELAPALERVRSLRAAAAAVRALLPDRGRGAPVFRAVDRLADAVGGRRSAAYLEGHASLVAAVAELGVAMRAVTRSTVVGPEAER
jgi:hypothetical protein